MPELSLYSIIHSVLFFAKLGFEIKKTLYMCTFFTFLAHLSHRLKVSFCDLKMSIVFPVSVNNFLEISLI